MLRLRAAHIPNYPGPRAERAYPALYPIRDESVHVFGGSDVTKD